MQNETRTVITRAGLVQRVDPLIYGDLTQHEAELMSALRGGRGAGLFVEKHNLASMDALVSRGHAVKCHDGRYRLPKP